MVEAVGFVEVVARPEYISEALVVECIVVERTADGCIADECAVDECADVDGIVDPRSIATTPAFGT